MKNTILVNALLSIVFGASSMAFSAPASKCAIYVTSNLLNRDVDASFDEQFEYTDGLSRGEQPEEQKAVLEALRQLENRGYKILPFDGENEWDSTGANAANSVLHIYLPQENLIAAQVTVVGNPNFENDIANLKAGVPVLFVKKFREDGRALTSDKKSYGNVVTLHAYVTRASGAQTNYGYPLGILKDVVLSTQVQPVKTKTSWLCDKTNWNPFKPKNCESRKLGPVSKLPNSQSVVELVNSIPACH